MIENRIYQLQMIPMEKNLIEFLILMFFEIYIYEQLAFFIIYRIEVWMIIWIIE